MAMATESTQIQFDEEFLEGLRALELHPLAGLPGYTAWHGQEADRDGACLSDARHVGCDAAAVGQLDSPFG